jgi:hypothetical protein
VYHRATTSHSGKDDLMKIHEYQARDLLRSYGIPVPDGRAIAAIEDAAPAFKEVTRAQGTACAVVKAQVHAGGRGKAGFVKLVTTPQDAETAARDPARRPRCQETPRRAGRRHRQATFGRPRRVLPRRHHRSQVAPQRPDRQP